MSEFKVADDGIQPNVVLDAKGLSCPMPLLRTKKEIGKLSARRNPTSRRHGSRVLVMIFPGGANDPDINTSVRKNIQDI